MFEHPISTSSIFITSPALVHALTGHPLPNQQSSQKQGNSQANNEVVCSRKKRRNMSSIANTGNNDLSSLTAAGGTSKNIVTDQQGQSYAGWVIGGGCRTVKQQGGNSKMKQMLLNVSSIITNTNYKEWWVSLPAGGTSRKNIATDQQWKRLCNLIMGRCCKSRTSDSGCLLGTSFSTTSDRRNRRMSSSQPLWIFLKGISIGGASHVNTERLLPDSNKWWSSCCMVGRS